MSNEDSFAEIKKKFPSKHVVPTPEVTNISEKKPATSTPQTSKKVSTFNIKEPETLTPVSVSSKSTLRKTDSQSYKINVVGEDTLSFIDRKKLHEMMKNRGIHEINSNEAHTIMGKDWKEADKAKQTKPERPFRGVQFGGPGGVLTYDKRKAKADLRNNVYPRNVQIKGVMDERFRIFEVVADGRCLFGTIWLLTQNSLEINRLLSDMNTYKDIEDFNDNGGLNAWIKTLFNSMTKCHKIKMMVQYFAGTEPENSQISEVLGEYESQNNIISIYCDTNTDENAKIVGGWYQSLRESGVVGKFDQYLSSLYTNQTPYENFESSYKYADIELFGDFFSDTFRVNIKLVESQGKTPYVGDYSVYRTYTGKPDKSKRDIYIYYKAKGHFQPMIQNSILDERHRGPQTSAAISSIKTYDDLKSKFSKFFDTDIIRSVFEAQNKDIASTNNLLQEMIEGTGQPFAQELKQLKDFGFSEKEAVEGLGLSNGNVEQALDILKQKKQSEQPNSRRNSNDSDASDAYFDSTDDTMGAVSSTLKSRTVSSTQKEEFEKLKETFPEVDDRVIKMVFDVHNNDYKKTNTFLKNLEETNNENKKKLRTLVEIMGFDRKKSMDTLNQTSNDLNLAITILSNDSNSGTHPGSLGSQRSSTYDNLSENGEGLQNELDIVQGEKDACLAEKKSLYEYFTFPKRLKIKYIVSGSADTTPVELPSTGTWGSFRGKTSTTDRIQPLGEEKKPDSVYSKLNEKFTSPNIQTVEIFNGNGSIQKPDTYKDATEDWYFLVTLGAEPVLKGGRTQKRHYKGGRMRSHKKRKMRLTRGRLTKRQRLSLRKRRKNKSKKSFFKNE